MRGAARGALGVLLGLALAACAGLPGSGPVNRVDEDAAPLDVVTRYAPAPPAAGATPTEIVRGFLDAQLAYPLSTATASEYLSPDAVEAWVPSAGVRVYDEPVVSAGAATGEGEDAVAVVELRSRTIAQLDAAGHYRRVGEDSVDAVTLRRVDGQWRIDDPPDGTMVTERFAGTYYRPIDVYYFDARGTQLLADPVHLPVGDQLATAAMSSLTSGPPDALGSDARTYLPPQETWRPAVTISDVGVAEVEFDVDLAALDDGVRSRWSAQVVRTLAQVPGVTAVRIRGASGPLVVGDSSVQPTSAWQRFEPDDAIGLPTAVADGRVVTFRGDVVRPAPGPRGQAAGDAVLAAATSDAVAVVSVDGNVRVGAGGDELVVGAEGVVGLAWDAAGVLWVADTPDGVLRVRQVAGGEATAVATPALRGVTSFALDAGARRWAATTADPGGAAVLVGLVERDQQSRVVSLRPPSAVDTDLVGASAVVWSGPTGLRLLADVAGGRQVVEVAIDGASPAAGTAAPVVRLPAVGARRLAATAGADPDQYVTDDRDRLWFLRPGGAWRELGLGSVTGLTSGR